MKPILHFLARRHWFALPFNSFFIWVPMGCIWASSGKTNLVT